MHMIHSQKLQNVGLSAFSPTTGPPYITLPLGNEVPLSNANHADNIDNVMTSTMQGQQ